jgi:hypothetical protein
MPLKIELIAETPGELERMLRALLPLIPDVAPASEPVAILNEDGKVAAFAVQTETKPARGRKPKTEAPAELSPAGSEDPVETEGLDAPVSVDAADKDPQEALKAAIEQARTVFARGAKGSTRIAELRAKYNPDPSNKKFKFEDVPAERISEFADDIRQALQEIPA